MIILEKTFFHEIVYNLAIGTNVPHKKFLMDLPHMNFPHGSTAQDFPHIYTSARIFRTFFCINKSCLNFNKIVFIEMIGKKSLKNVRTNSKICRRSFAINFLKNCVVHSFLLPFLRICYRWCRDSAVSESASIMSFQFLLKNSNAWLNLFA